MTTPLKVKWEMSGASLPLTLRDQAYIEIKRRIIRFATKVLTTPRDEDIIADRQQLLMEKMTLMNDRLSDGRTWLCGEQFTLADIALAPRVDMFPIVGVADLYTRFSNIGKFMDRMKARPSWTASAVRPEPGETERAIEGKAVAWHRPEAR